MRKIDFTRWFDGDKFAPSHVGIYEVRNNKLVRSKRKDKLTGWIKRYWNGENWMCGVPGTVYGNVISIFGNCRSHQWRGLRDKPE